MSALLCKWLNTKCHFDHNISKLEEEFSNGYLFLDLLRQFNIASVDFAQLAEPEKRHTSAKIQNFEVLQPLLKQSLGLHVSTERIREIMMEEPGAAGKLLYQIKRGIENHFRKPKPMKEPATKSLRPPEGRRYIDRNVSENEKERFIQETINEISPSDPYVFNKLSMSIHLRKFRQHKWKMECDNIKREKMQQEEALQKTRQKQTELLASFREKKEFIADWTREGNKEWKKNRQRDVDREAEQLRFELTMRERRRMLVDIREEKAANDYKAGVDDFEKNLKRLGIEGGTKTTKLEPMKGSGLDHLKDLEHRVQQCNFSPQSNQKMMKELRAKRETQMVAQKERDVRRRKMNLDQQTGVAEAQRKNEEQLLRENKELEQLKARDVKEAQDRLLVEKQLKTLEREERVAMNKESFQVQLDRDLSKELDRLHHLGRQHREDSNIKLLHLQAQNRLDEQKRHEKHVKMCTDVLSEYLDFLDAILQIREYNDGEPIDPREYRILKQNFVYPTHGRRALDKNEGVRKNMSEGPPAAMMMSKALAEASAAQYALDCRQGQGSFHFHEIGTSTPTFSFQEMEHTLATLSSDQDNLAFTKWSIPSRPLIISIVAKDPTASYAKLIAESHHMEYISLSNSVDLAKDLATSTNRKELDITPGYEELKSLGEKLVATEDSMPVAADMESALIFARLKYSKEQQSRFESELSGYIIEDFPRSASQAYWFEKKVTQLMMDDENEMNEKIKNLDLLQKNKLPDGIQLSPALSWMFIIDHSSDTLITRQMNHWEPPAEVGSMDDAIDAKEADQESSREVEEKSTAYLHRLREDFEQGLRIQYSVWDDEMSRLKEFYSSFHCFYQFDDASEFHSEVQILETMRVFIDKVDRSENDLYSTSLQDILEDVKQLRSTRRAALPRVERLLLQDLSGEISLDLKAIEDMSFSLVQSEEEYRESQHLQYQELHLIVHEVNHGYIQLTNEFEKALKAGFNPQSSIDRCVQRILRLYQDFAAGKCSSAQQFNSQRDEILLNVELRIGNELDDCRANAATVLETYQRESNTPRESPRVESNAQKLIDICLQCFLLEKQFYHKRKEVKMAYFKLVEQVPEGVLQSEELKSLMELAKETFQSLKDPRLRQSLDEVVNELENEHVRLAQLHQEWNDRLMRGSTGEQGTVDDGTWNEKVVSETKDEVKQDEPINGAILETKNVSRKQRQEARNGVSDTNISFMSAMNNEEDIWYVQKCLRLVRFTDCLVEKLREIREPFLDGLDKKIGRFVNEQDRILTEVLKPLKAITSNANVEGIQLLRWEYHDQSTQGESTAWNEMTSTSAQDGYLSRLELLALTEWFQKLHETCTYVSLSMSDMQSRLVDFAQSHNFPSPWYHPAFIAHILKPMISSSSSGDDDVVALAAYRMTLYHVLNEYISCSSPTVEELLQCQRRHRAKSSSRNSKHVLASKKDFFNIPLWFEADGVHTQIPGQDLKEVLYHVFADSNKSDAKVDMTEALLHFCCMRDPTAFEPMKDYVCWIPMGFLKAFCFITNGSMNECSQEQLLTLLSIFKAIDAATVIEELRMNHPNKSSATFMDVLEVLPHSVLKSLSPDHHGEKYL